MGNQAKKDFSKLRLKQKYFLLKKDGEYIASRFYRTYHIHLYLIEDFYAEVWMRVTFNELCWIEIADEKMVLENYLDHLNPGRELNL